MAGSSFWAHVSQRGDEVKVIATGPVGGDLDALHVSFGTGIDVIMPIVLVPAVIARLTDALRKVETDRKGSR